MPPFKSQLLLQTGFWLVFFDYHLGVVKLMLLTVLHLLFDLGLLLVLELPVKGISLMSLLFLFLELQTVVQRLDVTCLDLKTIGTILVYLLIHDDFV